MTSVKAVKIRTQEKIFSSFPQRVLKSCSCRSCRIRWRTPGETQWSHSFSSPTQTLGNTLAFRFKTCCVTLCCGSRVPRLRCQRVWKPGFQSNARRHSERRTSRIDIGALFSLSISLLSLSLRWCLSERRLIPSHVGATDRVKRVPIAHTHPLLKAWSRTGETESVRPDAHYFTYCLHIHVQ